ncbi:hypothetical protein FOXB_01065, partial [Fusarium oxysporum f. sp. conglutinans Fo5176]
LKVKSY